MMGVPAFPFAQLLVFWGGVQHGFNGFRHNPVEYAQSITSPVLLLHGAEDVRVTEEQVRTIADNLQGPRHLEVFPGAGHESCLDQGGERWQACVTRFLAAHGGEPRP
jgi:pimeloyl-ACP methyl ester carboxylesterase